MHSPKRILVPVDFSTPSRAALQYAAALGDEVGASVDVLHVWHSSEDVESRRRLLTEFAKSDEGGWMMEWLASLEQCSHVEVRGRVAPGGEANVADAILREVKAGEYDLVVMGMHARQGFWHHLMRGVADEIVRRAPCPVLTIRAEDFPAMEWVDSFDREGAVAAQPM